MPHARRPSGPVAAAQKCATYGPLSVLARGGGCTAWSSMRRFSRGGPKEDMDEIVNEDGVVAASVGSPQTDFSIVSSCSVAGYRSTTTSSSRYSTC